METRANPVPYILAGVLVLMAVLVGFKGCTGDEPKTSQAQMREAPEAPPADADTPADTIRNAARRGGGHDEQIHGDER